MDDEITHGTWAKVIEGCSPDDLAREVRRTLGLRLTPYTKGREIEETPPGSHLAVLSLQSGTHFGVESENNRVKERVSRTEFLDRILRARG